MRKQALTLPYMGQASLRIVPAEGKVVCIDPYCMISLLPMKLNSWERIAGCTRAGCVGCVCSGCR